MSEQQGHQYLREHQLSGELLKFDLGEEQIKVLDNAATTGNGVTARTLVKDGPLRIVIVGLKQGSGMNEHKTEGTVSIHALQGRMQLSVEGKGVELAAGSMVTLGAGVSHSVHAEIDGVLIVTIAAP